MDCRPFAHCFFFRGNPSAESGPLSLLGAVIILMNGMACVTTLIFMRTPEYRFSPFHFIMNIHVYFRTRFEEMRYLSPIPLAANFLISIQKQFWIEICRKDFAIAKPLSPSENSQVNVEWLHLLPPPYPLSELTTFLLARRKTISRVLIASPSIYQY